MLTNLPRTIPYPVKFRERLLLALAALFVLLGTVMLSAADLPHWSPMHWLLMFTWAGCFGVAHVALSRYAPDRDPYLLPLAALLTGWGLLLIARLADVAFLIRQVVWMVVGMGVLLLIASRRPGLRWLRRYRYTWLLAGLVLLAGTLILGKNPSGYGPQLWLGGWVPGLGDVYLQPSEILKLLMVVYLASYLAEKRVLVVDGPRLSWMSGKLRRSIRLPSLPYLAPLLVMWGLAMVLLAWQQDLGAALLFFFTFLVMLYLASGQWGYVVAGAILFLIAASGAYRFIDTVALRVDIWANPWADPAGRAFQIVQSLIAVATGGLIGQGLGQGSPTYIPAIHTDFPFAAIAEEFGLLGVLGLIAVVTAVFLRGARVALTARSPFRRLLAAGLATILGLQSWIIMAGNSKLIPLTGVTLPFVSYGGSSLLSSFIALGLLITISRDEDPQQPDRFSASFESAMAGPIRQVSLALVVALVVLAGTNGYWALIRCEALTARDDNPRLVEAEQRIRRGPVLDRHKAVLAHSQPGQDRIQRRVYFTPAPPPVGYYSLKHGVGGLEESNDALLRGTAGRSQRELLLDDLLHRQPPGRGVLLTIDAELQRGITAIIEQQSGTTQPEAPREQPKGAGQQTGDLATDLADGPGDGRWRGALVLMDVSSGEILTMISHPTFNPNTLDAEWNRLEADPAAPLLNRATQGLYQPGGVLEPIVLAAALNADAVELDAPLEDVLSPVRVNGAQLNCSMRPAGRTLADAVMAACPTPFAALGETLGAQNLEAAFQLWRLDTSPPLEVPTTAGEAEVADPGLAAIGQEQMTVTPLHVALMAATIGNGGVMPAPRLVLKTEDAAGSWQPSSPRGAPVRVIDAELAERLHNLLPVAADGQARGHSSMALAGADRPSHIWYVGLAPARAPRYAVAVLSEHAGVDGLEWTARIGHDALLLALAQIP